MTKEECAKKIKEEIDHELTSYWRINHDDNEIQMMMSRVACLAFNLGEIFGFDEGEKRRGCHS